MSWGDAASAEGRKKQKLGTLPNGSLRFARRAKASSMFFSAAPQTISVSHLRRTRPPRQLIQHPQLVRRNDALAPEILQVPTATCHGFLFFSVTVCGRCVSSCRFPPRVLDPSPPPPRRASVGRPPRSHRLSRANVQRLRVCAAPQRLRPERLIRSVCTLRRMSPM